LFILLVLIASFILLLLILFVGLRITPKKFATYEVSLLKNPRFFQGSHEGNSKKTRYVPLPDDLPARVKKFFRQYMETVCQLSKLQLYRAEWIDCG
jgi:hypothetical protein